MPPNEFKIIGPITKAYQADGKYFVQGLASGTATDLEGERMAESAILAFQRAVQQGIHTPNGDWSLVPLMSAHRDEWSDYLGWLTEADVDADYNLIVTAELDSTSSAAMDLYRKLTQPVEMGRPRRLGLSIGGIVVSAGQEYNDETQMSERVYYNIALKEVSVTSRPAYAPSYLTALAKSVDWERVGTKTVLATEDEIQRAMNIRCAAARDLPINTERSWDGGAAKKAVFAWAGGDAFDPSKARQAFLAYDASKPKERGSYHLPFAMPIDGKLTALASGIRAAASRLDQTQIPASAKKTARGVIDAYEKRFKSLKGDDMDEELQNQETDEVEKNEGTEQVATDAQVTKKDSTADETVVDGREAEVSKTDPLLAALDERFAALTKSITEGIAATLALKAEVADAATDPQEEPAAKSTDAADEAEDAVSKAEIKQGIENVFKALINPFATELAAAKTALDAATKSLDEQAAVIADLTARLEAIENEEVDKSIVVHRPDGGSDPFKDLDKLSSKDALTAVLSGWLGEDDAA